jgi:trans-aconitate 2-methyltransferase
MSGADSDRAVINTGAREWDAETYHKVSDPQFEWGLKTLDRLQLSGDEVVLDAGCGSGRVTEKLLERLPGGRVIAIDGSEAMVAKAREALGERAELRYGDLARLEMDSEVDVVFSTAVFHWLPDHDNLFRRLRRALRPGGRLVAQCGGQGNVASLAAAIVQVAADPRYASHFEGMEGIWNFAGPDQTERRLIAAGFAEARCWLHPAPLTPEHPLEFLATVTLGPHLARLPEELRDDFTRDVAAELGDPVRLDYVRLNIDASRDANEAAAG